MANSKILETLRTEAARIRAERARVLAGLKHDIEQSGITLQRLADDLESGRVIGQAIQAGHVRVLHPGPPPSMPTFELPDFRDPAMSSGTR